jgi:hypothetical protein
MLDILTQDDKQRLKNWAKDINSAVLGHPSYEFFDNQQRAYQLIYKYGSIFLKEINNLIVEAEEKC